MSAVGCLGGQERPCTSLPSVRPGSRPMKLAPHGPPRTLFAATLLTPALPVWPVLPAAVFSDITGVAIARAIFLVSSGSIRLAPVSLRTAWRRPIASSRRSYAIVRRGPVRSVGLGPGARPDWRPISWVVRGSHREPGTWRATGKRYRDGWGRVNTKTQDVVVAPCLAPLHVVECARKLSPAG